MTLYSLNEEKHEWDKTEIECNKDYLATPSYRQLRYPEENPDININEDKTKFKKEIINNTQVKSTDTVKSEKENINFDLNPNENENENTTAKAAEPVKQNEIVEKIIVPTKLTEVNATKENTEKMINDVSFKVDEIKNEKRDNKEEKTEENKDKSEKDIPKN